MSKMHEILLSKFPEATQKDLDTFSKNVRQVESSGGTNLVNPDSSARGDFQFLTKGDGNSFQTALNRLSNTYASAGHKEPDWVDRARRSNNPMDLPYEQQEELMLANIYQQKGSDALLSKAFTGDRDASLEAYYKYHHTAPDAATIAAAESAFTTDSRPQVAEVPAKIIDNIPRVSAGFPSFSFDSSVDNSEIKKMATPEAQAYFKDFNNLDSLPSMGSRLVAPMQQRIEDQVIPVDSYSPGVDMNVKPKPMYPLAGTVTKEPQDTGPAQFAEIETLFNEPKTYVPASGRMDAYSYIDNTIPPHASEFSQAYVAPAGREPAGVAVEQQQGILEDQFGKPVRSGNNNVIGLPTQNAAYAAPAGGKGANATPQSAIDQLTGIKGFGGK
jgi:hypothetical protein